MEKERTNIGFILPKIPQYARHYLPLGGPQGRPQISNYLTFKTAFPIHLVLKQVFIVHASSLSYPLLRMCVCVLLPHPAPPCTYCILKTGFFFSHRLSCLFSWNEFGVWFLFSEVDFLFTRWNGPCWLVLVTGSETLWLELQLALWLLGERGNCMELEGHKPVPNN